MPFILIGPRAFSSSLSVDLRTRVCRLIIHACDRLSASLKREPLRAPTALDCCETLVLSGYQFSLPFEKRASWTHRLCVPCQNYDSRMFQGFALSQAKWGQAPKPPFWESAELREDSRHTPHLGVQELSLFFRSPSATAQTLTWSNSQCPRKPPYSCPEDREGPRDPFHPTINSGTSKSGREDKPGHLRPLSPGVWTDVMESEDGRVPCRTRGLRWA